MKLTDLLDQIERLDKEATKGPWDHTVEWAEIGSGSDSVIHGYGYAHCDGCDEQIEGVDARVALSPDDAEFIALARTARHPLAKALRGARGPLSPGDAGLSAMAPPALTQLARARRGVLDAIDNYGTPRTQDVPTPCSLNSPAALEAN